MIAQRLQPVLDEIVGVRVDSDVDALALEDRQQLLHRAEERPLGLFGALGPAGELGVDHVDAEVDGDLNDALPVAHRGLAGILVGAGPAQHRQHRRDADTRVGARLAELGDQFVVGAGVVEERDEVPMRGQLQVLVTQFRYHAREVEQLVVVVERRGIQRDLHSGTHPLRKLDLDALAGLQRPDTRFADRRGGVTVPRGRPVDVDAGPDGVDPPLHLDVVGRPESLPEARRDPAAPRPGADLADQSDVETNCGAAEFTDDLGAHLIGDTSGDEHLDVDVSAADRLEDRDLRVLQSLAVHPDSASA